MPKLHNEFGRGLVAKLYLKSAAIDVVSLAVGKLFVAESVVMQVLFNLIFLKVKTFRSIQESRKISIFLRMH